MLKVDPRSEAPLFRQVSGAVREMILSGRLAAGQRLPSTRSIADELGVSRSTVLLAFEDLLAEGYIAGRQGSGTFVAADLPRMGSRQPASPSALQPATPSAPPRLSGFARRLELLTRPVSGDDTPTFRYDFRFGLPALADFPADTWNRLQGRRARATSHAALGYAPTQGSLALRTSIARYLLRARGIDCDPAQLLITTGSQQALDLTARVLLDQGDPVLIEDPHYLGARDTFIAAGATLIPVPVDPQGLVVSALRQMREAERAKLIYVTPSHQFPLGCTLSLPRRVELLAWARRCNAFIVEDDYDSEFRYGQQSVDAIQSIDRDGRVIYVGTFSKVLFPALRIGYLLLPRALVAPFVAAKALADRHNATHAQDVLDDFIASGQFERHLRRSRVRYAATREALLSALAEHFGTSVELSGTSTGLHVLAWLNDVPARELPALVARAASLGVGLSPATPHFLEAPTRAGLVLGYAHMPASDVRAGIRALAQAVG